jgi:hypothetical protein
VNSFLSSKLVLYLMMVLLASAVAGSLLWSYATAGPILSSTSLGSHTVKAVGKPDKISAQASFNVVSVDWPMFGYDPQHTHFNPYENVLNTTNVSSLQGGKLPILEL